MTDSPVPDATRGRGRKWSPAIALFLGCLVLYGFYWRVDVFIVDTLAVANALANVADGHLHVTTIYYGPTDGGMPGMYTDGTHLYGRNYGHVAAALPLLLLLKGLSVVADLRVVLAGCWSLALAGVARQVALATGRRRLGQVGIAVAILAFATNVAWGTALDARLLPLVALQLVTLLAAAAVSVVVYRLIALLYDERSGVAAGVAVAVVGPVGFWASIPKRHVVTALFVVTAAYLLARSRATGSLRDRALAYVPVGATAWVSAPEGLLLLFALGTADVATSPRNGRRELAVVGAVLLLSLIPFLATNVVVSGSPLTPPRLLTSFRGANAALAVEPVASVGNPAAPATQTATPTPTPMSEPTSTGGTATAATTPTQTPTAETTSTPAGRSADASSFAPLAGIVAAAASVVTLLVDLLADGAAALDPGRLFYVFVRSGRIPGVAYDQTGGQTLELTLLESAPLLAALAAAPAAVVRARPTLDELLAARTAPTVAVDVFAVSFVVPFTLVHLPRLPLHSTITVRYLVPTVPLLVYAAVRIPPVRRVAGGNPGRVAGWAAAFGVGGGLWLAALGALGLPVGGLMQAHAVVNLAVAAAVGGWLLVRPADDDVGAAVLGLVLAASVLFLLATGVEYFSDGRQFALPLARAVESLLPIRP